MSILNRDEEMFLSVIIEHNEKTASDYVELEEHDFPMVSNYDESCGTVIKSLVSKGYLGTRSKVDILGYVRAYLTISGKEYFNDKRYMEEQEVRQKSVVYNIGTINAEKSNVFMGDVTNSSVSLDNTIKQIEERIMQCPEEEQQELRNLLEEATEIISNMEETKRITKQGSFMKRIGAHMEKHKWFYAEIVTLVGTAMMKMFVGE